MGTKHPEGFRLQGAQEVLQHSSFLYAPILQNESRTAQGRRFYRIMRDEHKSQVSLRKAKSWNTMDIPRG